MEFQLLYDFLKSGKTQKAFAKEINTSISSLRPKLNKQLHKLEKSPLIKLEDYVQNKHSILIVEVRSKREMWLQAIEAYNAESKKIEFQKKFSERYHFSFDEINQFSKWFNSLNTQTPDSIVEEDKQLYSKILTILEN